MAKKLLAFGIVIVLIFSLAGCKPPKEETGLRSGFTEWPGDDPIPSVHCAYEIDVTEISVGDDLAVKLFYGSEIYEENISAKISMFIGTGSPRNYADGMNAVETVIKEVDDYQDDKYRCTITFSENWMTIFVEYTCFENVSIPAVSFIGEQGFINFVIQEYMHREQGIERSQGDGQYLYYRIEGEKVLLSMTEQ